MFYRLVTEKAAFRWLRADTGDLDLLLAAPPRAWQSGLLWVVRIDSAVELRRAIRTFHAMTHQVTGICWFAGHRLTLELGEKHAHFRCGQKFIWLGERVPVLRPTTPEHEANEQKEN